MRSVWSTIIVISWVLCICSWAEEESVFDQGAASFTALNGKIDFLKEGGKLYTDRSCTLKVCPRELSSTRYVMAPFNGGRVHCERAGIAFVLALMDPISQEQTRRVETFLKENRWNACQGIPEFSLFYTNGADRPAQVYWKHVAKDEEITCPNGMILCFRCRQLPDGKKETNQVSEPAAGETSSGSKVGATVVEDAEGDFLNPDLQLTDYDIRRVTIERKGVKTLELTWEVAGDIERRTVGYAMFIAMVDLDKNRTTGQDGGGLGSDINVRIYQDPHRAGWQGAVDKVSAISATETFTIDRVSIRRHQVAITVTSKVFKGLESVRFFMQTSAQGTTIDRAPDKGAMEISLQ